MFTIYERETLRPIGNTALHGVDHRNRSASFGIMIGEPECRGKGLGTETTRLMLDYASPTPQTPKPPHERFWPEKRRVRPRAATGAWR
jgi:RimJ/RimL family protein N-acetyltransferase